MLLELYLPCFARSAIFYSKKTLLPHISLLSSIDAIASQRAEFQKVLPGIKFSYKFSPKEKQVIGDASRELYSVDNIEGQFFHHGQYAGIISAVLFFRKSESIYKCWKERNPYFRPWLVKCAVSMVSKDIIDWIPVFLLETSKAPAY